MGSKYIHYGHDRFIPEYFAQPSNYAGFTKPRGGLWASPVDSDFGWAEWCEFENFHPELLKKSFTFEMTDGANVLLIEDRAHLRGLPRLDSDYDFDWCLLDFEELIRRGVDAVEVHIRDYMLHHLLYGWDCDSIVVLNPDVIVEVD